MLRTLAFAVITMFISGCGTIYSLQERYPRNKVFSGVVASWNGHATFIDIPFSLVADTIALPYTIPKTIANGAQSDDKWKPSMPVADNLLATLRLGQSKSSVQELLGQPGYYTYYCPGKSDLYFPALTYRLASGSSAFIVFDKQDGLAAIFTLPNARQRSYLLGENPCS